MRVPYPPIASRTSYSLLQPPTRTTPRDQYGSSPKNPRPHIISEEDWANQDIGPTPHPQIHPHPRKTSSPPPYPSREESDVYV
ncbi:hypothetical protein GRF29_8g214613 [Pseudopithomyces chartarum]|uniref:Uncharacterized protein n=1 Tax=Pseudopithomyces chartarum TaxID=1892770 RepID=A0AAN6RM47_9PLEO|nr:hypothetical protein GRF29_8g214613 [Pseudopithomyces chartarum]